MLRKIMFGLSLLAFTTGSAFAATATHKTAKSHLVAQADTDAPKPAKKAKKSKKAKKGSKADAAKGDAPEAPEAK